MKIKTTLCYALVFTFSYYSVCAQNLLNLSDWTIGQGSTTLFSQLGSNSENNRIWGEGPHGQRTVLWEANPTTPGGVGDGGWKSQNTTIDHDKAYRVSIWVKKTHSDDGTSYFRVFGGGGALTTLDGNASGNKNVWYGDLPLVDRWYLVVGYIHASSDASLKHYGGVYDGRTGQKLLETTDFKFQSTTTGLSTSSFLFYSQTSADRQYHYAPRIDEVNSNEPTLTELLGVSPTYSAGQENLLNLHAWTAGPGSTDNFTHTGATGENERAWGIGPHGQRTILWESRPDGSNNSDGGFTTTNVNIDHNRMYRYSVWFKKSTSTTGQSHFGPQQDVSQSILKLDSNPEANPYFWYGQLPQLDQWYLLVGYVHGSSDTSTESFGKIYDGTTGAEVLNMTDFKFSNTNITTNLRAFLQGDTNINGRQYTYAPRLDEVNGFEPSIIELLSTAPISTETLSIGTQNLPDGYKLSVGGQAIVEKIRVQLETAWPDYVFEDSYNLQNLKELKAFIEKNGHLPGMPSATEVEKSHQDLGLIQQKLLKQIEELTLYAIQADENSELLKKENSMLKKSLKELINRIKVIEQKLTSDVNK